VGWGRGGEFRGKTLCGGADQAGERKDLGKLGRSHVQSKQARAQAQIIKQGTAFVCGRPVKEEDGGKVLSLLPLYLNI